MTRLLRGAWSRRGALATLVTMTAVVVGGTVGVLGFVDAAGSSRLLTAPLLLLGAVAVPSIGHELANARREEIGLARLRGIHGARLVRFLLLEPALAIALGAVLGVLAGAVVTLVSTAAWLGDAAAPLSPRTALLALAVAAGGLAVVAVASLAALREPLSVQVATRQRPRRATTLVVFLSVLVIVGAGVAAYRARGAAGPDAVVLLGPALVGLALGQVAIWVLRIVARAATGTTSGHGLAPFLATRRLARADDLVTPLRLVVAAAVVAGLTLTGAMAVDDWTDAEARIASPGAVTFDAPGSALAALALTHELDPAGEHLMATALVPNASRLSERRAFVDAARFAAVVGDHYAATPVAPAVPAVAGLAGAAPPDLTVTGDRVTVTARPLAAQGRATRGIWVEVTYVLATNDRGSVSVPVPLRGGGERTVTARLPGCSAGCQLTGLGVERRYGAVAGRPLSVDDSELSVLLRRVTVGDRELADLAWQLDASAVKALRNSPWGLPFDKYQRLVANLPDGIEVRPLAQGVLELVLAEAGRPVPVLSAGETPPTLLDIGGDDRVPRSRGDYAALPLVGSVGTLADLAVAGVGAAPTVPSAEVTIVAGAGTPDALLARVADATGTEPRTLDDVRRAVGDAAGAEQARAYTLMTAACALVALLALAAGVARHRRGYRRDVAALRVVGIGPATARRAGRTELAALAVLVAVAVLAGGWLAVRLLLGGLPLLTPGPAAPLLDTAPTLPALLVPAALATLAVLLVGGRARVVRPAATRPALLREDDR